MLNRTTPFVKINNTQTEILLLGGSQMGDGRDGDYLASGACMAPYIQPGDRLRVVAIDTDLRPGWIVLFSDGGKLQAHRVTRVRGSEFWSRGDNAAQGEGPNPISAIVGRVIAIKRKGIWRPVVGLDVPLIGLTRSRVLWAARALRERWPSLFRSLEEILLGSQPVRFISKLVASPFLKEARIETTTAEDQVVAELLSVDPRMLDVAAGEVEDQLRKKRIFLIRALSAGGERLGSAIVLPVAVSNADSALVLSVRVNYLLRGLGIGVRLVNSAACHAKGEGFSRICASVACDNARSQRMFDKLGYRKVPVEELEVRGRPWTSFIAANRWLLERAL